MKLLLCILLFISPGVFAKKSKPTKRKSADSSLLKKMDSQREELSTQLYKLSTNIDSFFTNEHSRIEDNKSSIRLSTITLMESKEFPAYDFFINTRINLPTVEKKLQIFVASINEDEDDNLHTQNNTSDVGAGLSYRLLDEKSYSFSTDGGLRFVKTVDPYVKLRLRNTVFGKVWETRFVQTLYWFKSVDYEFESELFFDRKINSFLLFRVYNSLEWSEFNALINLEHSHNLIHKLNKTDGIIYSIGVHGTDEPLLVSKDYFIKLSFKSLIYQDWLFMTLAPGFIWRREDHFEIRPQFLIRFDVIIGST